MDIAGRSKKEPLRNEKLGEKRKMERGGEGRGGGRSIAQVSIDALLETNKTVFMFKLVLIKGQEIRERWGKGKFNDNN